MDSAPSPGIGAPDRPTPTTTPPLLRIHEVAKDLGLTTRTIRYWEEMGLLDPVARSGGAYRLYAAADVARLRFIRSLREEAGFSLAEVGRLLEDRVAGEQRRAAYEATTDPAERRRLLRAAIDAADRQLDTLRSKVERLEAMVESVDARRTELLAHLATLESTAAGPRR